MFHYRASSSMTKRRRYAVSSLLPCPPPQLLKLHILLNTLMMTKMTKQLLPVTRLFTANYLWRSTWSTIIYYLSDALVRCTCIKFERMASAQFLERDWIFIYQFSKNMARGLTSAFFVACAAVLCVLLVTENGAVKQLKHPALTGSDDLTLKVLYWYVIWSCKLSAVLHASACSSLVCLRHVQLLVIINTVTAEATEKFLNSMLAYCNKNCQL